MYNEKFIEFIQNITEGAEPALVESIMSGYNLIFEGIHDKNLFKAIFLIGGPGSGKSYISSHMFDGLTAKVINSDIAFEQLTSKANIPMDFTVEDETTRKQQSVLREKSKSVTAKKLHSTVNGMIPVIIDGTGKDYEKTARQIGYLKSIGYDVSLIFINTSLDVALSRNSKRKRKVDDESVKRWWTSVQNNMGHFQRLMGKDFYIIDNTEVLEGDALTQFILYLRRLAMRLLNAPLENRTGKYILRHLENTNQSSLHDLNHKNIVNIEKNKEKYIKLAKPSELPLS